MQRHLLRVHVALHTGLDGEARNNWKRLRDVFTGKLVKSLLIDGNPGLKTFFEKTSGGSPKLMHVTPLYVESSKIRCVHSLGDVSNGRYTFYVGFIVSEAGNSPSFDSVYNALLNVTGRHRFKDTVFDVELVSVESLDVDRSTKDIASGLARSSKLKVVFMSPTLLRDPFRSGKHKSLTPTPMNIFSTPVYINLYLTGRLRQKTFAKTLIALHRLLNEPYSVHRTVKVIKVKYDEDKNPIPALIGYINLYLNGGYYEYYSKLADVDALLQETLATTLALGTGTSRATGFGHINLAPSGSSSGVMDFPETKR